MSMQAATLPHDAIAALAHKFWEEEGRPEGRAESHWLRAVETLAIPAAKPVAKPAVKAKAPAKKAAKGK